MPTALRRILAHSIQAKLIAMTGAIVMGMVCILTIVIALTAANLLSQQSSQQLSQSLTQSAALLSNFLDVRDSNLNLWAANPLVEAVSNDPDMAPIFIPSLKNYFNEIKKQEPWIAHIFLIRNKSIVYDNSNAFLFSNGNNGSPDGIANLLAIPDKGISVMNLHDLSTQLNKPVLLLKRPVGKQGSAENGAYLVLVLDFELIYSKLFAQFQIGQQGFVSMIAQAGKNKMVISAPTDQVTEEKDDFTESSRTWRTYADVPNQYQSIILKKHLLSTHPLAIVGVASRNDARRPVKNLLYFSGAFGLMALGLGIWSAIILSKRITIPIQKLTQKAEQLTRDHASAKPRHSSSGNPDNAERADNADNGDHADPALPPGNGHNFLEIDSKDELGRLALGFAQMQYAIHEKIAVIETQNEQLKKSDQAKEELNQSLEQKVHTRTQQLQAALSTQQTISGALQEKSEALDQSYKQLELRTSALSESHHKLEHTLRDLRAAHSLLIQSEKMASLGQLVASVAHEINNPIGAVKSSGENISDAIGQVLGKMPEMFQVLDKPSQLLFSRLVSRAKQQYTVLNSREERAMAMQITQQLEAAGIDQARHRAATLVQLRAQGMIEEWLPLLRHPECDLILATAFGIATIVNNTSNINIAVDRVTKIIFALKSFSRIDNSGKRVEVQLHEGMETVLTIYQNQIRQGAELVRHYETIPSLFCYPDELNQVWTNLIHNALQAMKAPGTLTVSIRQINHEAVVSVADTGCGIPEDIRGQVFDAFFTTKPTGEGSGLGLDIVKKIIDKHKGRIEFESEIGVGTTFSVYLPYRSTPN